MALFNVTAAPGGPNFFNSWISDIQDDGSGDLVVYGNFTTYNNGGDPVSANNIIKIDTNGVIQGDFDYGTGFGGGYAFSQTGMAIDGNGDMYFGGSFNTYQGTGAKNMVKLDADGSIDTSFVYGTGGSQDYLLKPAILNGGDIVYPGRSTVYNGTTTNRLFKVSPLGAIDTTYDGNVSAGANNVTIQVIPYSATDDHIVHGYHTTFAGTTVNHIMKLNGSGVIDTTFDGNVGTGFNNATANNYMDGVLVPSDKVIMTGLFTDYNGSTIGNICRLNTNGTLDTTFNNGGAGFAGGRPYFIARDSSNERYLVTGVFTSYNGTSLNGGICLINSDGTLNTGFTYIPLALSSLEVVSRIGSFWYVAYNDYTNSRYFILEIDDNGNKRFI